MSYTAAVVGLGNIGLGYDYEVTDDSRLLTHASGFAHHPHFDLVGAVDPDAFARDRFERKYGLPAFATVQDLHAHVTPEVVSIGVPTPLHADVFHQVLDRAPRAILCEKPIAQALDEGRAMLAQAEAMGTLVLVNYMRRFEPGVLALKRLLDARELGAVYKGTMWYSKGLLNNGSHFIDLLRFLLGEVTAISVLDHGRPFGAHDAEPDVRVVFGAVPVYFLAGREECFSMKELELIAEGGSVSYARSGEEIRLRRSRPSELFPSNRELDRTGEVIPTDLSRYQWHVLQGLSEALTSGTPLNSDGDSALGTLCVVERIRTMMNEVSHA